jgi:TPP-dependent pyruvate/acetoin dehydrogenase alpha subunit
MSRPSAVADNDRRDMQIDASAGAPGSIEASGASPEELERLLRQMLLIRAFDETALELIWSKRIEGVVHPYIGQEGSAVGICAATRPGDRVISNHRGHGHCIAAGADVQRMMAEIFGRATGYCKGKGGSMHIADFDIGMLGANGIVGAGVPMAVGAALSDVIDGEDRVSIAFFGDGATGQGIVYEAINFAALWKLPVLFVCENNGWASDTPLAGTLPVSDVAGIAEGHGVPAQIVDAQDVLAVRAASIAAVEHLRAGRGPRMIECITDRWKMHASRQVPMADTRDAALLQAALERDPIVRLRELVLAAGVLDEQVVTRVEQEVRQAMQDAVAFAEASPHPEPSSALEDVFA